MNIHTLETISPTDGRYADKTKDLRYIFSEFGLIKYRVFIEIRWLQFLSNASTFDEISDFNADTTKELNRLIDNFTLEDAETIKNIEKEINHDVKAVEYFIARNTKIEPNVANFIHFGCTSEDINNLAYALMLQEAKNTIILPLMSKFEECLASMVQKYAKQPMLSRTHGQIASPTTLGKELSNFLTRLRKARNELSEVIILGKFNGAVGNFNAHIVAYPDCDWIKLSTEFIESLNIKPNINTTQIEPHDWMASYAHALHRYNTILINFCRDIWGYISLGYFKQRVVKEETGSSTMPHKINPIDFENGEGNLGLSNALLNHFAIKLPISRWQRDLTDSTVQRNLGVALGYFVIALKSILKGVEKLEVNYNRLNEEIDQSWEVLGEAIQTVMRRYGIPEPYEKLKALTRDKEVTQDLLKEFITSLDIPKEAKNRLLKLTPKSYIGLAEKLAKKTL